MSTQMEPSLPTIAQGSIQMDLSYEATVSPLFLTVRQQIVVLRALRQDAISHLAQAATSPAGLSALYHRHAVENYQAYQACLGSLPIARDWPYDGDANE